jgi:hypothetical protein
MQHEPTIAIAREIIGAKRHVTQDEARQVTWRCPYRCLIPPPLVRALSHPLLMPYNRLVVLVLAANLALAYAARPTWWSGHTINLHAISNFALANVTLAILIRQQLVINLLFWLATRAPTTWPLRIRSTLGKVYHFGGLHVGAAIAGALWFVALAGSQTYSAALGHNPVPAPHLAIFLALAVLLVTIVVTALPPLRQRFHNIFERTHRFAGWAVLALFWAQTVVSAADNPRGVSQLRASPSVWVLAVLTISIALPWLRLRRVPILVERPSSHAALTSFNYGVTPFAGSSMPISLHPLLEWHSFANIPSPGRPGFRLIVSRAGDWTQSLIDNQPSHVWVKGIPVAGVASIVTLFTRVVWVATGSGIGPVLPHLLAQQVPAQLVWPTRSPRATYGDALIDEILAVQPNAIIWDTTAHGKPDMIRLVDEAYSAFHAEAVICISNKKLTRQLVHGLQRRGIPAYGPIWDS